MIMVTAPVPVVVIMAAVAVANVLVTRVIVLVAVGDRPASGLRFVHPAAVDGITHACSMPERSRCSTPATATAMHPRPRRVADSRASAPNIGQLPGIDRLQS